MMQLMLWQIIFIDFIVIFNSSSGQKANFTDSSEQLFRSYLPYIKKASDIVFSLPSIQEKLSAIKDTQCLNDIKLVALGIKNDEEWALKMFDASTKFPNDLFEGNSVWLGSPSVCQNATPPYFQTHFCWINIMKELTSIQINLCLPNSCQEKHFNDLALALPDLSLQFNDYQLIGPLFEFICAEEFEKRPAQYSVSIILILCFCLIVIVIFATFCEIYWQWKNAKIDLGIIIKQQINNSEIKFSKEQFYGKNYNNLTQVLFCFSALKNGKKIIEIKKKERFSFLDGVRAIAFLLIVFGHVAVFTPNFSDNPTRMFDYAANYKFIFIFIQSLIYNVDSFFILSGFLATYNFLVNQSQEKSKSWFQHVSQRYFRISPAFYFALIFHVYLFNKLNLKNNVLLLGLERQNCKRIWPSVFYIGNYYEKLCFGHSWYLFNDMQFHLLLPLILQVFIKSKLMGFIILITTLLASSLLTFIVTSVNDYDSILQIFSDLWKIQTELKDYQRTVYYQPYSRINPFIAGILCGWLCFRTQSKIKLTKVTVLLLYFLCCVCFYAASFYEYHFYLTRLHWAIFSSLRLNIWSIGFCILIFLCFNGYGGIINSFLSWPGWYLISEVSYSSYLVHLTLIYYYSSEVISHDHYQVLGVFRNFLIYIQLVMLGGLSLYLTIEAPAKNIQNMYQKRKKN